MVEKINVKKYNKKYFQRFVKIRKPGFSVELYYMNGLVSTGKQNFPTQY